MFDDMQLRPAYPLQTLEGRDEMDAPPAPRQPGRLGRRRDELGMTQAELADLMGTSARTIQNWEAGRHLPRGQALRRYAKLLEMPVGELLADDPEPSQLDRIEAKLNAIVMFLGAGLEGPDPVAAAEALERAMSADDPLRGLPRGSSEGAGPGGRGAGRVA